MAGESKPRRKRHAFATWIKWTKGLTRKREVFVIAERLDMTRREVASACMEVWEWADDNTVDGFVGHVSPQMIDTLVTVVGFGDAMVDAGWLLADDAGIVFPNFERHNGEPAKLRATKAEQKRLAREDARKPFANVA